MRILVPIDEIINKTAKLGFIFYVPYQFRTSTIVALRNFLSFVGIYLHSEFYKIVR